MTKEELLEKFPKNEKIDLNVISELLDGLFYNCEHYQDIFESFRKYIDDCLPGSDLKKYEYGAPERQEYYNFIYGEGNNFCVWIKFVEEYFLEIKGMRRTFEEACKLAADKWCEMLFDLMLQDNGAINEMHGGGFYACALGTFLKEKSRENITEEMIEKTWQNLYDYYKGGSMYHNKESGYNHKIDLYCDYYPNAPLDEILEHSGIPENVRRNICPWKSGVQIDDKDNAVVLIGYQKREYV